MNFFLLVNGSIGHSFNRTEKQKAALGDDSSSPFPGKTKQNKTRKKQAFYLSKVAFDSAHSTEVPLTGT